MSGLSGSKLRCRGKVKKVSSVNLNDSKVYKDAILIGAKWTALQPQQCEKHFVVHSRIERAKGPIETVRLEAVRTKSVYTVSVADLADVKCWRTGWH